ncbi:MAG: ATP-binding cassette domain-containing protein [Bacilli bacterium]
MLELKRIKKSYKTGEFVQHALKDINVKFRKNEFVAILGPSGSGKTTLLNIIGGLDKYDSGDLIINGKSTKKFKQKDWDSYRNNCIGFIFQSYNLISHITVLQNIEMGMTLSGMSAKKRHKKALEVLKRVGLKDHAHKKPNQLSGGQMQRVAIARALANNPEIILADEPTGALDSKTSIQIMELIKEIAKDKLVIMVTHNPELANDYANRIVEFKDGELINDSNPVDNASEENNYKIKKTSMNYLTALKLSFNNIKTKKGRTLITAFASSIGIIGIALILSLSNGFKLQIDKFEKDTLSQAPIVISEQTMDMNSMKDMQEDKEELEEYPKSNEIHALKTVENILHTNNITKEYMDKIEKINPELIGGIAYQRGLSLNVLSKVEGKVKQIDQSIFSPLPTTLDGKESSVMKDNFEVIYGNTSINKEEILLLVDSKNRVSESILKALGFEKDTINFEDIVGKEFKIVLNDDYYKKFENLFIRPTDLESLYNKENTITVKISAVIRGKEDSDFAKLSGTGLMYNNTLTKYIIEKNNESEIVKAQKRVDYNVLSGQPFDLETKEGKDLKQSTLSFLGADTTPLLIQIYPKDFDSKDEILKVLDDYNEGKSENDKIIYLDQAKLITTMSGNIMDAITIVLIAFSAISLIVSSIMIGIITYISVLERTKEIGILRALGARKKDITRVFNAETFIIGLTSGTLGLIIAKLLTFPANHIIENLTSLENVAKLNPVHAIVLLIISISLTVIGGLIPSKIAAKKDPVEALRSE